MTEQVEYAATGILFSAVDELNKVMAKVAPVLEWRYAPTTGQKYIHVESIDSQVMRVVAKFNEVLSCLREKHNISANFSKTTGEGLEILDIVKVLYRKNYDDIGTYYKELLGVPPIGVRANDPPPPRL
jgi:hypothetical protein